VLGLLVRRRGYARLHGVTPCPDTVLNLVLRAYGADKRRFAMFCLHAVFLWPCTCHPAGAPLCHSMCQRHPP
jgi:hypothetical protein